ncbi:hypothetical protein Clacol_006564 [Clathrus columnatus]|uniref:Inositol-pentakisphosphate 2-kinase n=1 Tax=Clathrus columnatus TaxID=1419009 RepID=A0AAV5AGR8_9AGAM|nr:hypothetical protein Clacol_006564 [Clathrus columnatus]
MLFDLTQTNPKDDWSYLTEGGASVVFAYIGLQHSVCSGKVLRVRKTSRQDLAGPDLPEPTDNPNEDIEDASVVFQKSIISQLLPEHYLPDTQSVRVTEEWLSQLAVYAEPFRPDIRKQNSLDKNRRIAVLVTNLVVKGLTIEIKNSTFQVLSRALLRTGTASKSEIGSAFVETLLPRIMESNVFQVLRDLQRKLDPLDIEGLAQMWSILRPNLTFGESEPEPDISEWKEFVDVFKNGRECTFRHFLLAYLLSATFKDCSVIIRDPDESYHKIFVIDVGPKSIQRLRKWKELDEIILSHFMRLSESGPKDPCIDLVKPIQINQ